MPHVYLGTDHTPVRVENIYCIGRNYVAHAAELGHTVEDTPVVFLKPTTALLHPPGPIVLPGHANDVHHEVELVALVGQGGADIDPAMALNHIAGYGLGLDLTARDVQQVAKARGLPWATGKGFAGSACITPLLEAVAAGDIQAQTFSLSVNGCQRQQGDTRLMVYPMAILVSYLSRIFHLQAGDLIYTGTPAGVAAIRSGDTLRLQWDAGIDTRFVVQ
jgi:2-keto-4-pentenoate hydratase/2-oxohepta-3-ene-1,7-dioic acid hydratase in catechol pathway